MAIEQIGKLHPDGARRRIKEEKRAETRRNNQREGIPLPGFVECGEGGEHLCASEVGHGKNRDRDQSVIRESCHETALLDSVHQASIHRRTSNVQCLAFQVQQPNPNLVVPPTCNSPPRLQMPTA